MSLYIPTVLEFRDGLLFLELETVEARLVWTNGYDLLFPFEPIILQLLFPQFSIYPDLQIIVVEPVNCFRRGSAISVSDFVFWLQDATDITFNTSQSLVELYLESRKISIQSSDYPIWLQKLQAQLPPTVISPSIALTQLGNLRFS